MYYIEYNNEDEDKSLKILNNKNKQNLFQKFRQTYHVISL